MTAETIPKSPEAEPLDFSKIEGLFKKLDPNVEFPNFQFGRTRLNDGTFIQVIRRNSLIDPLNKEGENELVFEVSIDLSPSQRDLHFELVEDGLRNLRQSAVDIKRDSFAFDVSIGESLVGRWSIHGKTQELALRVSSPLLPRKEASVKAGSQMIDWLQGIIETGSFSEPPINLSLVDPETIK